MTSGRRRSAANVAIWLVLLAFLVGIELFVWNAITENAAPVQVLETDQPVGGNEAVEVGQTVNASGPVSPHAKFALQDTSGDGLLSLEELLAGQPEELHRQLTRDFKVVNWNGDQGLSEAEYYSVPSRVPVSQREAIPDPVVDLVQTHQAAVRKEWTAWDADQNGELSQEEFAASELPQAVPGLRDSTFALWNLDGQAGISADEAATVIDVAFGVRALDGTPLRKSNGQVFSWMGFRWLDVNGDGFLVPEELMEKRKYDREKADAELGPFDRDKNGKLSMEEAWGINNEDPVGLFFRADMDLNGLLSQDELVAAVAEYHKRLVEFVVPAFDADGDGELDFTEFRLSPLANFHEEWHVTREDQDHDGFLSLAEFGWGRDLDGVAMVDFVFRRLDRSGDQRLDPTEFAFRVDPGQMSPHEAFALQDANHDGLLSSEEFRSSSQNAVQASRDFKVFDVNSDGRLSEVEYLSIPSRASASERKAPPDPIADWAEEFVDQLTRAMTDADQDDNGWLSPDEFRKGRFTRSVPGLQLSGFGEWDLDGNGQLTGEEIRRVIHAACGVARLDGLPYRESTGVVYNAMLFRHVDEDRDDQLSRAEYLARGYGGSTAGKKFVHADKSQDGFLDYSEWIAAENWIIDPISDFLRMDRDFSGGVSYEELRAGSPEWQLWLTPFYLRMFDDDNDGALSLTEYRRVPAANLLTAWHRQPVDRDGDGRLSFSEFYDRDGVHLVALASDYFRRLDEDGDGILRLHEFDYRIDPSRVSIEIAFRYTDADRDQSLVLDELLGDYKGRSDPGSQAAIGRIEEAFLAADRDGDQRLSLHEFDSYRELRNGSRRAHSKNLSSEIARNQVPGESGKADSRLWLLLAFNVLLVGGVAWYALTRK